MKILHTVESYLPQQHGMSEVVRQISEYLVKAGHDVTVATSFTHSRQSDIINGVKIKSFKLGGNNVLGIIGDASEYQLFLMNSNFDVITNFAAQQWATDLCLNILPEIKGKKVFVPTGFSGLLNPSYSSYFEKMKYWMKYYDMNVFLSNDYRDINFAKENGINLCRFIPNGASRAEFQEKESFNLRSHLNLSESCKVILHVGSYTGFKGHEQALRIFLHSRISNVAMIFVGDSFERGGGYRFVEKVHWFKDFAFQKKLNFGSARTLINYILHRFSNKLNDIFILNLDRQKLIATYQQSDFFLFPSMIECSPIVLFEALASKTPFLVTNVGNAREIVEWTNGGKLLPTKIDKNGLSHAKIKESANLLSIFFNDSIEINKMKEKGYSSWLNHFTWENIAHQYEQMYNELLT